MPNPWEMDWGNSSAPMMGPPPKVDPYKARDQELQEAAAARAADEFAYRRERDVIEDQRKAAGGGEDGKTTTDERTAAFLTTRLTGALSRIGGALKSDPTAAKPPIAAGIVGAINEDLGNWMTDSDRQVVEAAQLDAVDSALTLGTGAAYTPEQLESYRRAFFPQLGDSEQAIKSKQQAFRTVIEAAKLKAGGAAGQIDQALALAGVLPAEQPAPQGMNQSTNINEIAAPAQEQIAPSTNGFQTVDNPQLSGVKGEYLRRLEAGQGPGELVRFLREAGVSDPKLLQAAVKQAQFRKQNPNVPIGNYSIEALDDMDVPLSATESMMNSAAQSAPGAYAMHAGQGLSLNTLDNMAPNQERAELALGDAGNAHPIASLAGDVSGGVMAALTGEAGLARAGLAAGGGRAFAADTLYGAGAGAGAADDGNRLAGAGMGALAGAGGNLAGRAITGTAAAAVSPSGGKLADLYASGVRPTPGQRALAAGDGKGLAGLAGRALNAAEEGISSVPVIGAAISGARNEAREQFQIGAFNEALKEIGEQLPKGIKVGTAPHIYAGRAFDKIYDKAREGLIVRPDGQLVSDVSEMATSLRTLAEPSRKRFDSIVQNVLLRRVNGEMIDGASYKKIQSEIGKTIRGIRKNQSGDGELADALEDLQGVLDSAARRHSDPKAVELLDKADRGYAKFVRIQEAAKARGGDAGTFTPTQFDRSIQRNARGNRSQEYLRGEALMQDYADQGMSLVDRIPNSGSADRAFTGLAAAGGAGMMEPTSLTLLGALGALYAPGVRKGLTGAMAPRGAKARALAEQVRKRKRLAGASGATMAVQGTSPDQ